MISKKKQWRIFICVNSAVLLTVLLFPLYNKITSVIPISSCTLLNIFHLYCPACGGTRALAALYHMDIISSLIYNPFVIISILLFIVYEITMIVYLFKKGSRPLLLKPWVLWTFLGAWLAYSISRNLLLIWGIDLLGNIL